MDTSLTLGTLWQMTQFAQVTTLIGAGGKTTTLQCLSKEIHAQGKKVIATTTTKVYPLPFKSIWKDPIFLPTQVIDYPCFWYAGIETEKNKWIGPTVEAVDQAIQQDPIGEKIAWVIEGDGAREKKLKCWAFHEPQIPNESECVVLILGGGLWGKRLTDGDVHRIEKCPDLAGQVWTEEKAGRYLLNSPVFYPKYKDLFWVVLFNEYGKENEYGNENPKSIDKQLLNIDFNKFRFSFLERINRDHNPKYRPAHLRIATGDVKEGKLRWCDLW